MIQVHLFLDCSLPFVRYINVKEYSDDFSFTLDCVLAPSKGQEICLVVALQINVTYQQSYLGYYRCLTEYNLSHQSVEIASEYVVLYASSVHEN